MRSLGVMSVLFGLAAAPQAHAARQDCNQFAELGRLPDRFAEIASAQFGGRLQQFELFVLSDGICTCDNQPVLDRVLGNPGPKNINWSCRAATPDEQEGQ